MNINCVICSDLFIPSDSIFTTPCGHIFHHVCLVQWMERSKSCPQCRNKCSERNIFRIYFNNMVNNDSTQNTAGLLETVDNLTLNLREKDQELKKAREERLKLEDTLTIKEKKIEKMDTSLSRNAQIIATMRHEMDILSSHRASFKAIQTENAELKSKFELMTTVESILSASQHEVDEILKQNISVKDLSVMVGTLKRELSNNELRKQELRKQLQMIKNEFRAEKEEKRQLLEKLSCFESENHSLKEKLRKFSKRETEDDSFIENPERSKRHKPASNFHNELNTSSPMTHEDFKTRLEKIKLSDSPYLNCKSSSVGLVSALRKPLRMKNAFKKHGTEDGTDEKKAKGSLSIFIKPRVTSSKSTALDSGTIVYNGIGGTTKVLQSDLKTDSFFSSLLSKPNSGVKKKISPVSAKK